ncbi:MAG: tyrosine-type recombinase/integrase, partial [Candidatus Limivicinus sp.]
AKLLRSIQEQAGNEWAFPGKPGSSCGHKTRQAVWADVKRAAKAARLPANVGTHSARKVYAVRKLQRTGDLAAVQRALNHSDPAVTMVYAMADHLAKQSGPGKRSKPH